MGRRVTGVVYSDLGQAAGFMALQWVKEALAEKLGFSPYPGTLNVRLESAQETAAWQEVKQRAEGIEIVPADPSFCQARCFLVKIGGEVQGAALVPEVDGYPEDKIEVIAAERLKERLRIQDGDRVTLEFTV